MAQDNQYGPEARKRLELVRKQFRNNAAEQKKQQAAERNQRFLSSFAGNKTFIVRATVYAILTLVVLAVILTRVSEIFGK